MSNNKQSSIEWFLDELIKKGYIKRLPVTQFQQAKAMHKEEIIYATEVGYTNGYLNKEYDGHQHYNETFGE